MIVNLSLKVITAKNMLFFGIILYSRQLLYYNVIGLIT